MAESTNIFSDNTNEGSKIANTPLERSIVFDVEDFGSISHAEICLGGLTLFVGENNSGKTYLMQLIYGVLNALPNISGIREYMTMPLPQKINLSNFHIVASIVNRWLQEHKTELATAIFNSDISVGSVEVEFKNITAEYALVDLDVHDVSASGYVFCINGKPISRIIMPDKLPNEDDRCDLFIQLIVKHIIAGAVSEVMRPALFFPASRSGILLLYKDVLGKLSSYTVEDIVGRNKKVSENPYGITAPLYDFMQFLQTHKVIPHQANLGESLIKFVNDNLVDGKFGIKNSIILYRPNSTGQWLPAYLSSSMVNEISPLIFLLTSITQYAYVFYDEIETCFHPSKQIDLARLLVRLVNYGYHMIVSTHSDTMAAAINNLIMLFSMEHSLETTKSLGYTEEDLLQTRNVHVYQFSRNGDKTEVKELECYPEMGIGYDFELFYKSSERLYNETKTILGGG